MGYLARIVHVLLFIGAVWLLLPASSSYASGSWTTGNFNWGDQVTLHNMPRGDEHCHSESKTIIGITSLPENGRVCMYERPSFRYGVYQKEVPVWYGATFIQKYFVVSFGSDRNMYVVENMSADRMPIYVAGSNDLHLTSYISYGNNQVITYIKDFPTKVERITEFGQTLRYVLNNDAEQPFIPSTLPDRVVIGAASASENGKWVAVEVKDAGFIKIDAATRALYGFSNYVHPYNRGMDASIVFKISDDGTKIAAFDTNISPIVYSLDDTCVHEGGVLNDDFVTNLRATQCPSDGNRLYHALSQKYEPNRLRNVEAYGFNNDGDTLYFDDVIDANEQQMTIERTPLNAGAFTQEQTIEYLALGDSYASGEGDIESTVSDASYYLPGTEANNECHVSSRSYPFLLREQLNLTAERMQTVACSGARVLPDYIGTPNTYKGQGNRVNSLNAPELDLRRTQALARFKPGIVTQLEFVKKYQPKSITLMGGGNDVGFANILQYCASPTWQGVFINDTCGYAIEGSALREMLGQSIQSQYQYTLTLLRMIRQASPNTSVYVIGYPSFISEDEAAVCLNSAALNDDERTMINQGVTAMNEMLQAAATSMGVKYIDIQDALVGGRLCEGSEYVTGIIDIGIDKIINENTRESFHPNALGHNKIAGRIIANNFQVSAGQNGPILVEPVEFDALTQFGADQPRTTLQQSIIPSQIVVQSTQELHLPANSLAPGSMATLTMHSQPTQIGEIAVNNDGSLDGSITLTSEVTPGKHVLILDGVSSSGEPIYYYQFVTVLSQQANDTDADGIPDANDPCIFIITWVDEVTHKDICVNQPETDGTVVHASEQDDTQSSSVSVPRQSQTAFSGHATETPDGSYQATKDVVAESDTSGEVQGAHTSKLPAEGDAPQDNLLTLAGAIVLSTLVGGYGILKAIRSRS